MASRSGQQGEFDPSSLGDIVDAPVSEESDCNQAFTAYSDAVGMAYERLNAQHDCTRAVPPSSQRLNERRRNHVSCTKIFCLAIITCRRDIATLSHSRQVSQDHP